MAGISATAVSLLLFVASDYFTFELPGISCNTVPIGQGTLHLPDKLTVSPVIPLA